MNVEGAELRRAVAGPATSATLRVSGLNHFAYRCRDAQETRAFYEDILGLPLAATVYHDKVPSTGESQPYYHIFFEMGDGSYLAFFDLLDGEATIPDPATPT